MVCEICTHRSLYFQPGLLSQLSLHSGEVSDYIRLQISDSFLYKNYHTTISCNYCTSTATSPLQGFGQANHKVAQELIRKAYSYPAESVTWSNSGY